MGLVQLPLLFCHRRKLSGMTPDDSNCTSVLSACSHGGSVDQGWMIFNSMVEEGIPSRMEHCACMADLLRGTGQLSGAHDFLKKLPCKPSVDL